MDNPAQRFIAPAPVPQSLRGVMAAKKKPSPAFEFIVSRLQKNKDAVYADIKAAADKKKLKVHPIMFGRAQLLLGIAKKKKKKAKKAAKRRGPGRPPKRAAGRRGPGRPRKSASPMDSLESLIGGLKDVQRDRDQLRATLEKVRDLIDAAL